jgi:hypothetical protein
LIYFQIKNTLKNDHYNTSKHHIHPSLVARRPIIFLFKSQLLSFLCFWYQYFIDN